MDTGGARARGIKQAVLDILRVLDIDSLSLLPFEQTPTVEPFVLECIAEARERNYLSASPQPIQEHHIRIGAAVGHYVWLRPGLVGRKIAVLASLLMGIYYCIDDCCFAPESLGEYGSRIVAGRPQLEKGLDDVTRLNSELADMYPPVIGDLLRLSHQAYVMGNYLEGQMGGEDTKWQVSRNAPAFPKVTKTITSAATALYLLSFPPDAPFTSYLQTLPDGITVHINTADIMSYYKEAMDGEFNRVEQISELRGVTGPEMLGALAEGVITSHERVVRVLAAADPTGRLVVCHEQAIRGFVTFQALHPRYKLRDFGIFSF
ncbi:hypothetical protein FB451DRAFT_1555286 [Mycena latifolia]|nr:hypothetical protein FB451DRAFT_1555286 [Mycena latifolia]